LSLPGKLNGLDIYPQENIRIGKVYEKMGLDEQSMIFYRAYADTVKMTSPSTKVQAGREIRE
jgi:hypothetical protein